MPLLRGPSGNYWVPTMSPKQAAIYNDYHRYTLAAGPRRSGKTVGVADKVWRHAWDTDRARIGVYVKYHKLATDGGCWSDLLIRLEEEWLAADMGMRFLTPPKVDGATRQLFMEVSNRHSNRSRLVLNSLDFDGNVEKLTKGKRYSMVWFNELSNFESRGVFDASIETLRCMHLPYEAHQWIADSNPAEDGEDSWIYKLFYKERLLQDHPDPVFRDSLGLIEVMIEDNPFLDEREKANLIAQYRHDPDLYSRYIDGKWTRASRDSHFADVFRHDFHVIGNCDAPKETDWEVLLPEENCTELVVGWDMGDINHSLSFLEPTSMNYGSAFKLLDEIVLIKKQIGIDDLVEMALEKMAFWEKEIGKPIAWRHWSDQNAFDNFRALGKTYDAAYVYKYSDRKIQLQAAPKFPDSVRKRVVLLRRLLFDGRFLISARCQEHIRMLKGLRKGSAIANFVDRTSIHKHPFDSLTYALQGELPLEFMEAFAPTSQSKGRVIVVG